MVRPRGRAPRGLGRRVGAAVGSGLLVALAGLAAPAIALGHQLTGRFVSPLPLGAYLAGAAVAVGASFAILALRADGTAGDAGSATNRSVRVPRPLRSALAGLGLVAWLWILVQATIIAGGTEADTASLFLWTYGWVGLAIVSAFVGPIWTWLDPFSSLHRIGAAIA